MSGGTFERSWRLDPAHPALSGHFPGRPLAPGVMLLEQVALALHDWRGQRLARVPEAKFVAPWQPGETACVRLVAVADHATLARFEIRGNGVVLARGLVEGTA